MTTYADLEIGLHRQDFSTYRIELRCNLPKSEVDVRVAQGGHSIVQFDMDGLSALAFDDSAYGQLLGQCLFSDPIIKENFIKARTAAQTEEVPLRLRLFIGPMAVELHSLRWECLRDPDTNYETPLLTSEHIFFSRYLSSLDWAPVRLLPKGELRALVMLANPFDAAEYSPGGIALAPLDVKNELSRAKKGLGDIPVTELVSGGATLTNLINQLRDGYDILYLICHGALVDSKPQLWLEDDAGKSVVVSGMELTTRIRELHKRPRMIVLASCQSAGSDTEDYTENSDALAALGPCLVEAGIPAVIAMQGNITIDTIDRFMPVFFQELQRDGQIDRAMNLARGAVRDRHDWWRPILFMRLKSGRIWYTTGFADSGVRLKQWPALIGSFRDRECTPILGPGMNEFIFGSPHEIAFSLAEDCHFPMDPHHREDLPEVLQYLAVTQKIKFLRRYFFTQLVREILYRYGKNCPDDLKIDPKATPMDELKRSLPKLMTSYWRHRKMNNPTDPYQVLADLPIAVYINTNQGDLLTEALREAGKKPVIEICPWNDYVEQSSSISDSEPKYIPTVERPFVFHVFGRLQEPESLVLTEDDYFNYLIGATRNKDLIPSFVRKSLTDSALLFLGFHFEDWDFRVLFRTILSQEGWTRSELYAHIAAQIDPEEGRILEPEGARRYLEDYFQKDSISIYWGSPDDFSHDLHQRWARSLP